MSLVRWLDLYASSSFKTVLVCFGWGIAAFFLALQANNLALGVIGYSLVVTVFGPVCEEVLKSLILVYYVRRADFTYFVDGAILGFAAGTGFAVVENMLYLGQGGGEASLLVAFSRGFSTSLMHGSASALVGVSLGRLRFGRGMSRIAAIILGWGAAMTLHLTFNNMINDPSGSLTLLLAVVLGLGGVGLNAGFILWGLQEEKRWLRETLGLKVGVSSNESSIVQKMDDLDALLAPVAVAFGPAKQKQVAAFLRLQAQLGLKAKVQEMTPDPKLREELVGQIASMRKEMDAARRAVGVYCMSYVRSILPPETVPLLMRLGESMVVRETLAVGSVWSALGDKMKESSGPNAETGRVVDGTSVAS